MTTVHDTTTESRFYYPLTITRNDTSGELVAPFVTTLPLYKRSTDSVVILASDSGKENQGLYVYDGRKWRFGLSQVEISKCVIEGATISVFYDQKTAVTLPSSTQLYRNGIKVSGTTITPGPNAVWVAVTFLNDEAGTVKSVNNVNPDSDGDVEIGIIDIPGLETALQDAGKVKTVNSVDPDGDGNVEITIADIPNLQQALEDAGKVKTVNNIQPNADGDIQLTAEDVDAIPADALGVTVAPVVNEKIPVQYLPDSLLGALRYQTEWDASTNTPPIPPASESNRGWYYVVSVDGNTEIDGNDEWYKNDWIISNGTVWQRLENQNMVTSVNGLRGVVVLHASDIPDSVLTVNGEGPDAGGNVAVPVATNTTAGTVIVNQGSGLEIDADGNLSLSDDIVAELGFTPHNVVYVALNGNPATGNGKVNNPYVSIADAVLNAPDGSIIILMGPGSYPGNITLGTKDLAIIGQSNTECILTGSITLAGSSYTRLINVGQAYTGAGAALNILTAGDVRFKNFSMKSFSAFTAIRTDNSEGDWTGNVVFDNLSLDDGKIEFAAGTGNVFITMAPNQNCNSVVEVAGGVIDFQYINKFQRIDHSAGALYIRNARSLGTSTLVAAINSTAPAAPDNFLYLGNVSTWIDNNVQSFVNKTGACAYVVTGLTRNIDPANANNDVWAGTEVLRIKDKFDRDILMQMEGTNYTGAVGATLFQHIMAIDVALGSKLESIASSQTGVSIVSNGPEGVLKDFVAGSGIDIVSDGDSVTVTNTGVTSLSSSGAGISIVDDSAGVLKSLVAGTGVDIVENGNTLTISSTNDPSGGVSSLNTFVGDVTIQAGTNVTIDEADNVITINAEGGGSGSGVSSLNTETGAVSLVGGQDIAVSNDGSGNITIDYTGSSSTRVVSLNSLSGDLLLTEGSGVLITNNLENNSITIANTGVLSVENSTVDSPDAFELVSSTGADGKTAVIKQVVAGANVQIVEDDDTITLTVTGGTGTVKSINNLEPDVATGNVTLDAGNVGAVAVAGDTMQGPLNMNGNALKNLPDPEDEQDPVTLHYLNSGDLVIDNGTF